MEISHLNFEIFSNNLDEVKFKGKMILDPLEETLVFYDQDENVILTKKICTIIIIPHYLKENKIAFKEEKDLFVIRCDKKETLELKSYRHVLSRIANAQERKTLKKEKSASIK